MKKFTFILLAALIAVMSFAKGGTPLKQVPEMLRPAKTNVSPRAMTGVNPAPTTLFAKTASAVARSPKKAVESIDALAGDYVWNYSTASDQAVDLSTLETTEGEAHVKISVADATEGTVTISGMFPNNLVASVDLANGLIEIGAQAAGTSSYGDYDLRGLFYYEGDETNEAGWYYTTIVGTIGDDGTITFGTWMVRVLSTGSYVGYSLTPLWLPGSTLVPSEPLKVVTPPEGLVAEEYELSYTDYYGAAATATVNLGFSGSEVYLQGLCGYLPEAWIKGELQGAAVTFAGKQFFGNYYGYDFFFQEEDAVFTYDATANQLSADGLVYTYYGSYYSDYYLNPVIKKAAAEPEENLDELLALPEGLTTEEWNLSGYANQNWLPDGTTVNVAWDGNDVYVQNLFGYYAPNAWIKGVRQGDKVTFKSGRLVADAGGFKAYFVGSDEIQSGVKDVVMDYVETATGAALTAQDNNLFFMVGDPTSAENYYYFINQAKIYKGEIGGEEPGDDELVKLPEGAETEDFTIDGLLRAYSSSGWQAVNVQKTVDGAQVGNDIYVKGLAYWFPDAYVKFTVEGDKALLKSGQFVGEDEYGKEYITGSTDNGSTASDVYFDYNADTRTLTMPSGVYIFESGEKDVAYQAAYTYYQSLSINAGAYQEPEPVVAPEDLATEEYILVAQDDKGSTITSSVNVGFSGSDVYFQGFGSYLPTAWVKGTFSADGTTVTLPADQYLGNYYGFYDMYLNYHGDDVVLAYDAEAGKFTASQTILVSGPQYWFDYYDNAVISKVVEVAAVPAAPSISEIRPSSYGDVLMFNVPVLDTDGNGLVTSKLSYQFFIDEERQVSPLVFQTVDYSRLTEDISVIPYGFTENYDIYDGQIYLNMDHSTWNKIGIKSIYTGGGVTNETEIQWFDIKDYVTPAPDPTIYEQVTIDPPAGDVQSLSEINIYFGDIWIELVKHDNYVSLVNDSTGEAQTVYLYEIAGKRIYLPFEEVTEPGNYTLSIASGTMRNSVTMALLPELVFHYTIKEAVPDEPEDLLSQPVTAPEGLQTEQYTFSAAYRNSNGSEEIERTINIGFDGDDVWVQGISYYLQDQSWIKGKLNADKTAINFQSPQYYGNYAGMADLYFIANEYIDENNDTYPTVTSLNYDAATGTITVPDYLYILEGSQPVNDWACYGYYYGIEITKGAPVAPTLVEVPADLTTDEYSLVAQDDKGSTITSSVNVGFSGSDVYFQGISPDMPDAWVKGTFSEDGKTLTLAADQYMGKYGSYDIFFNYHGYDIQFTYDAEADKFIADNVIRINAAAGTLNYLANAVLTKVVEVAAMPADPSISQIYASQYGDEVVFNVPTVDVNGNGLVTSKLSFQFYYDIDHEVSPLTFQAGNLYPYLEQDMTVIPYGFTENYDFYKGEIFLNMDHSKWNKIGIKSIYTGGGQTNETEIQWYTIREYGEGPDNQLVELPQGLQPELYTMNAFDNYYEEEFYDEVYVAFDGNDVYVQGLCYALPDAWAKGTLEADGKVYFPETYMGVYSYYGLVDYEITLQPATFVYDKATSTFTSEEGYQSITGNQVLDDYSDVIITKANLVAATPVMPSITEVTTTEQGDWYLTGDIPLKDADGNQLYYHNMSYRLYTNIGGTVQPFVFTPADYQSLSADTSVLPYNYSDGYDIYFGAGRIYINASDFDSWNKVGLQSIYTVGSDVRQSDIFWYTIKDDTTVGIARLNADADDANYYDLQGRKASRTAKGLLLKQVRQADGTVKTVKVVK